MASEKERVKGNKHYLSAMADGICLPIKRSRLTEAMRLYNGAVKNTKCDKELSSAYKNSAMVNWRMAETYHNSTGIKEVNICKFYYFECIKFFVVSRNIAVDKNCQSVEWVKMLDDKLLECIETGVIDGLFALDIGTVNEKSCILTHFLQMIPDTIPDIHTYQLVKLILIEHLTKAIFWHGLKELGDGNYKACLRQMKECNYPVEQMKRAAKAIDNKMYMNMADVFDIDLFQHTAIAESGLARQLADEMLAKSVEEDEAVSYALLWTVVDKYKEAILLTRELDLEQEAIALSRLGQLYHRHLKMKWKAKEYFKTCMELCTAMKPRLFTTHKWYSECARILEEYQQEILKKEREQQDKERQKYIDQLKEEMEQLQHAVSDSFLNSVSRDGQFFFVKFVFNKFPPKDCSKEQLKLVKPVDGSDMKRILRNAIILYHPDRQVKYGRKWQVLAEEITKRLTTLYEQWKFEISV